MSEQCNHDCDSCSAADCASREQTDFAAKLNDLSSVKKVVGVVSGKGGVGKSSVTAMLSVLMNRKGYHTGVLDADITGPSIPKIFGIKEKATGDGHYLFPATTRTGLEVMSINLLLEEDTEPVVWRGPIIAGTVKQFWTEVIWKDIDYMFVDMPPGTGDVPLTVFQSLPLDGIVIVASPQELVSMIVEKATKMARMMDIPVLGIVENMSYLTCPDCGKKISLFGEGHTAQVALQEGIPLLAQIPLDPQFAAQCDAGDIEDFSGDWLDAAAAVIEKL